ncbi:MULTISPECIES: signal peptidase I [Halorussus]|uniref:signal peptidase I n=1 Tax=Halorussus TaxID=1070314 RepID=UPI000E2126BA|nr:MULTISPECIES: signal peptidase I [Halorussus]NHN61160.1 signal peptidase I [Halorussus sp. JP-T4]
MNRRKALRVLGLVVLVALVAPFVVTAVPQVVGADASYVVLSSSMSPAIHAGDVVVVNDVSPANVEEGDVVTYQPPSGHQLADVNRVTHRVVGVTSRDGERHFRTKGDANEEADAALVPASNVEGRVMFHIPFVGRVVSFAQSSLGLLLLVIVPGALLVVSELYDLYVAATEG